MHKLLAPRWTLPTIVILTLVILAIIAVALLIHYILPNGTAWQYPD